MIIQTLHKHRDVEDAIDSLAGQKEQPFFLAGYVVATREFGTSAVRYTTITLWQAADGALKKGQRLVETLIVGKRI